MAYWPERRIGYEENVWLGHHKTTGERVVMKLFDKERFADGPSRDDLVFAEVKILKDLSEQYPSRIVRFLDFYSNDEDQFVLVMERADCTLQDVLYDLKVLPEMAAREAVFGILEALACVHNSSLVHRDIKPANVMLMDKTDTSSLKLGDFGVTVGNVGYDNLNQIAGTMGYQAPEMLARSYYGRAVDLWSCGVVAYQLLYGRLPFKPTAGSGIFATKKIGPKQQLDAIKKGLQFPDDVAASEEAKDFIRSLLQTDPAARPKINKAMEHPWFGHSVETSASTIKGGRMEGSSMQPVRGHPGWMEVHQGDGAVYYYNQDTSVTTWNPPFAPAVPSRPRSISNPPTLERAQNAEGDAQAPAAPENSIPPKFRNLRDPDKLVKAKSNPNLRNPFHEDVATVVSDSATGGAPPFDAALAAPKRERRVQFNNFSEVIDIPAAAELEEEEAEEVEAGPEPHADDDEENDEEGDDEQVNDLSMPAPSTASDATVERRRATIAQMYGVTKLPSSSASSLSDVVDQTQSTSERRRRETISQMYGERKEAVPATVPRREAPAGKSALDKERAREIVGKLESTAGKYKDRLMKFARKAKDTSSAATTSAKEPAPSAAPSASTSSGKPAFTPLPVPPKPRSSSFNPLPAASSADQSAVAPAADPPSGPPCPAPPLPTRPGRSSPAREPRRALPDPPLPRDEHPSRHAPDSPFSSVPEPPEAAHPPRDVSFHHRAASSSSLTPSVAGVAPPRPYDRFGPRSSSYTQLPDIPNVSRFSTFATAFEGGKPPPARIASAAVVPATPELENPFADVVGDGKDEVDIPLSSPKRLRQPQPLPPAPERADTADSVDSQSSVGGVRSLAARFENVGK
ncbi:Calcium-dependent protein kinase 4 [Geranomyces variabilis]|nr:Calcium-dependent protein kinase 4 [Geranomyces variabilis]